MGEIKIGYNFLERITKLRESTISAHLELQLVWLCEMVILYCVQQLYESGVVNVVKINKGTIHYSEGRVIQYFRQGIADAALAEDYLSAAGRLITFRDAFVHQGIEPSRKALSKLLEIQDKLDTLAGFMGVTLYYNIQWMH